jgi:hypothetical protein
MATLQVITPVVHKSYTLHHICQSELAHVLELRRQREALDERISEAETAIRRALQAGAKVQGGFVSAYLKTSDTSLVIS